MLPNWKYYMGITLLVASVSCRNTPEILRSIEGNWYCKQGEVVIKETWEAVDHGHLTGVGSVIIDGVEKVQEYLELKSTGEKLIYVASVIEQNDGKPVIFSESSQSGNSITFENAQHDFPQFITYEIIDELNLKVTIGKLPAGDSEEKMELLFSRHTPE